MKKNNSKVQANPHSGLPSAFPVWITIGLWMIPVWMIFCSVKFNQKFPVQWDVFSYFLRDASAAVSSRLFSQIFPYSKSVICSGLIVFGLVGWGSVLVPKDNFPFLDRAVFSYGAGIVLISISIFILGLFNGYHETPLYLFMFLVFISGVFVGRDLIGGLLKRLRNLHLKSLILNPAYLMFSTFSAIAFVMCFVPELFYDSLVYHLGLPQMYLNEGGIVKTGNVYFSYFPMMMHMLYVLGLGVDGTTSAKLLNWSSMMMGMGAIRCFCAKLGYPKAGVWACLFVVSIPVLQMVNWSTPIDTALGSFTVLAALGIIYLLQTDSSDFKMIFLSGLISGTVMAIKYTGAATILIFFAMLLIFMKKENKQRFFTAVVIYGIAAAIASLPYLIRNYVWIKNPVYPILAGLFHSEIGEKIINQVEILKRYKPVTLMDWISFPWRQTMMDMSSFNFIGPLTLSGLPLVVSLKGGVTREIKCLLLITAGYFVFSLNFAGDIRYLLAGFFLLSVILGIALERGARVSLLAGRSVKVLILFIGIYHLAWLMNISLGMYRPLSVLLGVESRAAYTSNMHNGLNLWPWNGMVPTLKNLPDPCRVYILGTEQVYGFPRRFWYSSVHDETPLVVWANQSNGAKELLLKMKNDGFTHILFNAPESVRLKGYNLFHWTENGRKTFIEFSKNYLLPVDVKPIEGYQNSLFLFEIKEEIAQNRRIENFDQIFKEVMNL